MRLIKPEPGEMADRQSILELKIYHSDTEPIGTDKKQVKRGNIERTLVDRSSLNSKQHLFLDEVDLIRDHLLKYWIPDIADKPDKVEEYDKLYDELSEVNSQLWDLEDQARLLRAAPDPKDQVIIERKAEVLDCVSTLNDKRAHLVQAINALWNINSQEKLYC